MYLFLFVNQCKKKIKRNQVKRQFGEKLQKYFKH